MIRISVSRNLAEHPFVPAMGVEDFAEVERVLLLALRSLQHDELTGSYTPLAALDDETLARLRAEGLYADAVDPPHHAAASPTRPDGLLPAHRAASQISGPYVSSSPTSPTWPASEGLACIAVATAFAYVPQLSKFT